MTQQPHPTSPTASPAPSYQTCIVLMLGCPATGRRTIGAHPAALLDGVLVDNQLVYRPLVELFRWDGVALLPPQIWERVVPIRQAVLGVIEDLAPPTNSYVFTDVLEDGPAAAREHDELRSLAERCGSLFLPVVLTCDIDVQVARIADPDRAALRKGSDPEGYRGHRLTTILFQPPASEVIHLDTTEATPAANARRIRQALRDPGHAPTTEPLPAGRGSSRERWGGTSCLDPSALTTPWQWCSGRWRHGRPAASATVPPPQGPGPRQPPREPL